MLNRLIPQFTSKTDLGYTEYSTAITIGTLDELELSSRLQESCQCCFEFLSGQPPLCQAQHRFSSTKRLLLCLCLFVSFTETGLCLWKIALCQKQLTPDNQRQRVHL